MIPMTIFMSPINIPYESLSKLNEKYKAELKEQANSVIDSGWYILGEQVNEFEHQFAIANGSKYCIGVASGLDALILGLSVFDFPKGSKVLVPSNTYIATILAILQSGLIPVLVEPNEDTCNIDIEGVQSCYKNDCVAIMVVHLYGRLCEMDPIVDFARQKNIRIIEDCAQSHFAESNGIKAGNFGDIGAFSFYPTKNLGALGDAGAIVCKDEQIFQKLKALRNYGSEVKYFNKYIGWNSRLDEIQAAFLRVKLKDVEYITNRKRQIADIYLSELANIEGIKLPIESGVEHVWHIFNIRTIKRKELRDFLSDSGIGTEVHYPVAPCNQTAYKSFFEDKDYPVAIRIHNETLSLPISVWLTDLEIKFICDKIREFYKFKFIL
jgi:dTDP-4-amino-4,6-dideoxygalactose transaminase